MSAIYNRYFLSGTYTSRYPRANASTLQFSQDNITARSSLLDYGCGDGRYVLPLLSLYQHISITAFDIAKAPLEILHQKLVCVNEQARVTLIHTVSDLQNMPKHDVVLMLFGVLSHMTDKEERQTVLMNLCQQLKDETSKIIISVPNSARRFLSLQKQQHGSDIHYARNIDGKDLTLRYHLYNVEALKDELEHAGLSIEQMQAESLLPESWVTRIPLIGWIDRQCCKLIPARWGYGILICCRKKS